MEHPMVATCAVIGLPDEDLGQRVHAVLEVDGRRVRRRAARRSSVSGWCDTRCRAASSGSRVKCETMPER